MLSSLLDKWDTVAYPGNETVLTYKAWRWEWFAEHIINPILRAALPAPSAAGNPAIDWQRVVAWALDPQHQPANLAFTAGDERQAAYCIEQALHMSRGAACPHVRTSGEGTSYCTLAEAPSAAPVALREAIAWLDDRVEEGTGVLMFGKTENGDVGLWRGDDQEPAIGYGDTVEDALLDAVERALRASPAPEKEET